MHSGWKMCAQGSSRMTDDPGTKSSRQIAQVGWLKVRRASVLMSVIESRTVANSIVETSKSFNVEQLMSGSENLGMAGAIADASSSFSRSVLANVCSSPRKAFGGAVRTGYVYTGILSKMSLGTFIRLIPRDSMSTSPASIRRRRFSRRLLWTIRITTIDETTTNIKTPRMARMNTHRLGTELLGCSATVSVAYSKPIAASGGGYLD